MIGGDKGVVERGAACRHAPDDEALALITINPAKQLGIEARVGSIEVGKDGDIAIFNAHPLSIYAIPQKTIVEGKVKFDIDQDADDMRLLVNPDTEVEDVLLMDRHDHERCLEGAMLNELLQSTQAQEASEKH